MKQGNSTYDQRLTGEMFFIVLEPQPRFARKISNVPDVRQFCRARNGISRPTPVLSQIKVQSK